MTPERFAALKAKADELAREAERAAGAEEQILRQLKKEFRCSSLEEGEKLLAQVEKDLERAERECEVALAKFEKHFGKLLEE